MYRFQSLGWFAPYLPERKQCVKVNKIIYIQPAAHILSVNDLPPQDSKQGLCLFADDATELACGTEVLNVNPESKSDSVNNWQCANNMAIDLYI